MGWVDSLSGGKYSLNPHKHQTIGHASCTRTAASARGNLRENVDFKKKKKEKEKKKKREREKQINYTI